MAGKLDDVRTTLGRAGSTLGSALRSVGGRVLGRRDSDARRSTPPGGSQEPIADRPAFAPVDVPAPRRDKSLAGTPVDPRAGRGRVDYADMTVDQLRDLAADRDIDGRSNMNKGALVSALQAADGRRDRAGGVDYADMTVAELRDLASKREIDGRSSMNKADLVRALKKD